MNLPKKIRTAFNIWRNKGWKGIKTKIYILGFNSKQKKDYQAWINKFDYLNDKDRQAIKKRIENFSHKPLISIILPVYNVEEKWLRLCLDSVLNQLYTNWELCIADDCSPSPHIRTILEEYANKDARIKVFFRAENGHISAASNSALTLATGEFSALLDHDDELAEHALYFVAEEINRFPQTKMIYSDEDMIDEKGNRHSPKFKPDWSLDLFYSLNLITHLSVYKTEVLKQIGGFSIGLEGSQDYDLALRVVEQIDSSEIRHIPHILYHWRAIPGSVAMHSDEKPYAHQRARDAISQHLKRQNVEATVSQTIYNFHHVVYELPKVIPKVSIILFEDTSIKSSKKFMDILLEKTDYPNFEIILIADGKKDKNFNSDTFRENQKVIFQEGQSRSEILNYAVSQTDSDILCFFESEMIPLANDYLKELTGIVLQKKVGVVGGKTLYPDLTNRQNGIILGTKKGIDFPFRDFSGDLGETLARTQVINNFSAVSGIFTIRRDVFENVGGFDTKNFPSALYEIDLCLKLKEKGNRIVFSPFAKFIQTADSPTEEVWQKKSSEEIDLLKSIWKNAFEYDEFYNLNFSLKEETFTIALPPRIEKPWKF